MIHKAGCHCGAVKLEFEAPKTMEMLLCNCSICDIHGFQHIQVPQEDVTFLSGKDRLTQYSFGSHIAKHTFCSICGVKPLYQPRSHPETYSINYRCIEPGTLEISTTIKFDGRNWEDNVASIRPESLD